MKKYLAPIAVAATLAGCASTLPLLPGGVLVPGETPGSASTGASTAVNTTGGPGLRATASAVSVQTGDEQPLVTLLQGPDGQIPTQGIVWTSSDDGVARVNPTTGQVKGIKSGTAVVTATLQADPGVRATFTVTVRESLTVVLIKINPSTPTLQVGERVPLTAEVHLADGSINGNVAWSSSDDTIATVNPTTGEVSALREGRVTIAGAYAADSKYRGIADVTIVKDKSQLPPQASATPVVFGPDATPIPKISTAPITPTPTARPTAVPTSAPDLSAVLATTGYAVFPGYDSKSQPLDNGDGVLQRGETMTIRPKVENTGKTATDHIIVRLSMDDPNGSLTFRQSDFNEDGTLESLYVDTLTAKNWIFPSQLADASGNHEGSFGGGYQIQVSKACPHGYTFTINATMSDRYGNEWTSSFQVPIP